MAETLTKCFGWPISAPTLGLGRLWLQIKWNPMNASPNIIHYLVFVLLCQRVWNPKYSFLSQIVWTPTQILQNWPNICPSQESLLQQHLEGNCHFFRQMPWGVFKPCHIFQTVSSTLLCQCHLTLDYHYWHCHTFHRVVLMSWHKYQTSNINTQ